MDGQVGCKRSILNRESAKHMPFYYTPACVGQLGYGLLARSEQKVCKIPGKTGSRHSSMQNERICESHAVLLYPSICWAVRIRLGRSIRTKSVQNPWKNGA